jgi:streptogramin lyase
MFVHRRLMALVVFTALLGGALVASATTAGSAAAAPGPTGPAAAGGAIDQPIEITTGPDGNVWVTNIGSNTIDRVTPSGTVTSFGDPTILSPQGITTGPDGNLWFAGGSGIGRITPAGVVSNFPNDGFDATSRIAAGPDGNLWFTSPLSSKVGRITTAGVITLFGSSGASPLGITTGPDGALWFANLASPSIGRITTDGSVTTYTDATMANPREIAVGPDGNLWFTNAGNNSIGRINPTTGVVANFTGDGINIPGGITTGPNGSMWFTNRDSLGESTMDGVVSRHPGPGMANPQGITTGPDGRLWFADLSNNSIGQLKVAEVETFTAPFVSAPYALTAHNGSLWFTNSGSNAGVGRVTPAGEVTGPVFGGARTYGILSGPDGLWITQQNGTDSWMHNLGTNQTTDAAPRGLRGMATGPSNTVWAAASATSEVVGVSAGSFNPFAFGLPEFGGPEQITMGPDGNMWFTNASKDSISRGSFAVEFSTFTDPSISLPVGIVTGPDGALWFTNAGNGSIGRITTAGAVTNFPVAGAVEPVGITVGPDGNLWFTDRAKNTVVRLSTAGQFTTYPAGGIAPRGITTGPDGNVWFTLEGSNAIGRLTPEVPSSIAAPGRPTAVAATAGKQSATVTWVAPASVGSSAITGYTVTSTPDSKVCTTTGALTCVVSGLASGTPYTFRVTATNQIASGSGSVASNPVTPWDGAGYHPVTPARILDSRTPTGGWGGQLVKGNTKDLQVTGLGGASNVPAAATAVVMNVTATGGTLGSFVSAWPTGATQPTSSNLNFGVGETIPNLVTVKLGTGGKVSFANALGGVDVIADVVGYYDDGTGPGDLFTGITPTRLLDSRTPNGGWNSTPLVAGAPRDLTVRQPGNATGVPATATAIVANVTVTAGTNGSFVSVWPSGVSQPNGSNLNFAPGQTIPNLTVVKIGTNGAVRFANAIGSVDVIVDVVGYFDPTGGSRFHAINPTRILDDRVGKGLTGPWGPGQSRSLPVAGATGTNVPATATGLVANVTATAGTTGSFVTVFPDGVTRPSSSNLNFGPGQTIPNLVTVKLGANGNIALANTLGTVHLIADAVGYYAPT